MLEASALAFSLGIEKLLVGCHTEKEALTAVFCLPTCPSGFGCRALGLTILNVKSIIVDAAIRCLDASHFARMEAQHVFF